MKCSRAVIFKQYLSIRLSLLNSWTLDQSKKNFDRDFQELECQQVIKLLLSTNTMESGEIIWFLNSFFMEKLIDFYVFEQKQFVLKIK